MHAVMLCLDVVFSHNIIIFYIGATRLVILHNDCIRVLESIIIMNGSYMRVHHNFRLLQKYSFCFFASTLNEQNQMWHAHFPKSGHIIMELGLCAQYDIDLYR